MSLRGYHAFFFNLELRFPLLDALAFGFPVPWVIRGFSMVMFLDGGGVRPVFLPLPDRHHIRLVMSLDRDGTAADCLAVFDPDRIGENDVVSLLGNLKAALADPLAMLA